MKKTLITAAFAALAMCSASAVAHAATINMVVIQEDADGESVARNNRIQNAVLNTINQTLNAPAYQSALQRAGITGMDVYNERALTLEFYDQSRQRRAQPEIISLLRSITPKMDIGVFYTLYARGVQDPYTKVVKLQMSMAFQALNVADGRIMGGDNLDIDTAGVPFTGCAASLNGTPADPHCVKEFVSQYGERLARNAGNKLAIQLAAMLPRAGFSAGGNSGAGSDGGDIKDASTGGGAIGTGAGTGDACGNLPTSFNVTFRGFEQRQMNAVQEYMEFWQCAMDLDVTDQDLSQITFVYKTRASQGRTLRNIRLMMDSLGQIAEPQTQGSNQIVVERIGQRNN